MVAKHGAGMWPGYVHDHLLPRLYGFELLMAPYAIAHLKLGLRLKETGYDIEQSERLRVYLTNFARGGTRARARPAHVLRDVASGGGRPRQRGEARAADHGGPRKSTVLE